MLKSSKKLSWKKYIIDNVLSNFLSKMVGLGILEFSSYKHSGTYEFNNKLYYTYFWIKSFEKAKLIKIFNKKRNLIFIAKNMNLI